MQRGDDVLNGEAVHSIQWSKTQREAVLAETDRVLADPTFRKSHRCVALMRRMVELTLDGGHNGVKERTLGIEVFGRDPDYDSNSDPIVRMTANEIRKRLAQYYQENSPRQGVRIHLVPGSYLLEFHFEQPEQPAPPFQAHPEPGAEHHLTVSHSTAHAGAVSTVLTFSLQRTWLIWSVVALLVLAAAFFVARSSFRSSQYLFWKPLLESKEAPLTCIADDPALQWSGGANDAVKLQTIAAMLAKRELPTTTYQPHSPRTIPYMDAKVASQVTRWLVEQGSTTSLEPASSLTLQDLRGRPAVLIGLFDNPWTLALIKNLRFSPGIDPYSGLRWIADAKDPTQRNWAYALPETVEADADYALITRFFDPETGNWVVIIGGLGQRGTEAAAALLTYPDYAPLLPAAVRSSTNFQIVVKSSIIKGNGGPPQVVAFYAW